jgi:thioredoxin 2
MFSRRGSLVIVTCPGCSSPNRFPAARMTNRARCPACRSPLLPAARPIAIESAADFDELVRDAPLPVLVDFWAQWCPPCRMVAPELDKLAGEAAGRIVVAKVDTDALPEVAGRFAIRGIPTMIVFRGGRETKRISGARPASAIATELGVA